MLTLFLTSLALASSCPDPNLRQAVIGGETIAGSVVLHQKPLKFAEVRLYAASGKTAWVGKTDHDGGFIIKHLQRDSYRLNVRGWGSTIIRLDPKLDRLGGQIIGYSLQLTDNECVAYLATTG
jgi:hypothetical protein